jgi:hypothetical protein
VGGTGVGQLVPRGRMRVSKRRPRRGGGGGGEQRRESRGPRAATLAAGITRRAARHIFAIADAIRAGLKPGESVSVGAYALELYNEDLRDLSVKVGAGLGVLGPWVFGP